MGKIAIVVGHRKNKKGAYSQFLGQSEYDFNGKVASHLIDVADIIFRPDIPFASESYMRKKVLEQINDKNYDLVIELHFNSFHDKRANGVTALHYITNSETKCIAQKFVDAISEEFFIKKRDLMPISSIKERGGQMIVKSEPNYILLEPFFGSNKEALKFRHNEKMYADVIRQTLYDNDFL